jgi:hypothetical protein
MMREVFPGAQGKLGPVFWGTPHGLPKEYAAVSKANAVQPLAAMNAQTQADIKVLAGNGVADGFKPPCNTSDTGSGTLKCEACPNGCQVYSLTPKEPARLANERAYYPIPNSKPQADVELFRAHRCSCVARMVYPDVLFTPDTMKLRSGTLWATVRGDVSAGQAGWSEVFVENNRRFNRKYMEANRPGFEHFDRIKHSPWRVYFGVT